MATLDEVRAALGTIEHPYLGQDLNQLGMVRDLALEGGRVRMVLELATPACPARDELLARCREVVNALAGIDQFEITVTARVRPTLAPPPSPSSGRGLPIFSTQAPPQAPPRPTLHGIKHVVVIASGKGGVGKSTVAVNLALALAASGARTGLIDADIYGPSIPGMLGLRDRPEVKDQRLVPVRGPAGLAVMSMGLLTDPEDPAILRGPMVTKFLSQFVFQVAWGELDYLLIDLPPGTGDIHLTLVQTAPVSGGVVITTPQEVARAIASKGLRMLQKVNVPILGVVENMSHFVCPGCGERHQLFGQGGGRKMAAREGVPLLGEIPIDPQVVAGGDLGVPTVLSRPDSAAAQAYRQIAGQLAAQLAIMAIGARQFPQFHWHFDQDKGAPPWDLQAVSAQGSRNVPAGIRKAGDQAIEILWRDGALQRLPLRAIRLSCRCARCVEETSGRPLLDPERIPADLTAHTISSIGTYAVAIEWASHGCANIHAFDGLRRLGDRLEVDALAP